LRRWEALQDEFSALGVGFVAISADTPEEAARFTEKERLRMRVLADPDLEVIDLYGVRRPPTTAIGRGRKKWRPLAVPTTLLVDEDGVIRWIDQADDYRVRSDAARVLTAVREALGDGERASPRDRSG